jgi:hypothetical protein
MVLFKESPELAAMKSADAELHANQRREEKAGIRHETPEYQRLNAKANEAADKVSRWRGGNKGR